MAIKIDNMTITQTPVLPRKAVQGTGGGLFLMALFTMMWAGMADAGFEGRDHHLVFILFAIICLIFIAYGVRLFMAAKKFPIVTTEEDRLEGKKMGKRFGIIFGIEGTAIPIACVILGVTHHDQYIVSAIALIVGLHFYPMAGIFKRKIDYYLATWTCVIALISIFLIESGQPQSFTMPLLGIGVGLATTTYGVYMIVVGSVLINQSQAPP
jgi:hypothetical protein